MTEPAAVASAPRYVRFECGCVHEAPPEMLADEMRCPDMRHRGAKPRGEITGELKVMVTGTIPMAKVLAMYRDAISPDGGYDGTVNAFIRDLAEAQGKDMTTASDFAFEFDWKLQ